MTYFETLWPRHNPLLIPGGCLMLPTRTHEDAHQPQEHFPAFRPWVALLALLVGLLSSTANANPEPKRVSILRFETLAPVEVESCRSWYVHEPKQMITELSHALTQAGLVVVEREQIRKMYANEFELPNSDKKSVPKTGKFKSADYTIAASIAELAICEEQSSLGMDIGGFLSNIVGAPDSDVSLNEGEVVSRAKIVAQIISTTTGEVIGSVEAEGESTDPKSATTVRLYGAEISKKEKKTTPIERVLSSAITEIAEKVKKAIEE